ncbi:endonuclease/exonuclease/phosphatase family protein [Nesterenkonia flava]
MGYAFITVFPHAATWFDLIELAVTVVGMPKGLIKPAHRVRGTRRTGVTAVVACALILTGAAGAHAAPTSYEAGIALTSSSAYPAPGQPVEPAPSPSAEQTTTVEKAEGDLRVATLHANLTAESLDGLVASLATGNDPRARVLAETVQLNDPDVLLLTGVSFDENHQIAQALQQHFHIGQNNQSGVDYPYYFTAPTNSGMDSGADLDRDGVIGGPTDAIGYGTYPGQYGMIVFSKHPILESEIRTFQNFLWRDMPSSSMPAERYSELEQSVMRLAETTLWDVPVLPEGSDEPLHVIANSVATPPVAEEIDVDRGNDKRRMIADYFSGRGSYIYDDDGRTGPLSPDAEYVVVGQPASKQGTLGDEEDLSVLLDSGLVQDPAPEAVTEAPLSARPGGTAMTDETATRAVSGGHDVRASFILPSWGLEISESGVFWPSEGEVGYRLVDPYSTSNPADRLVWVDLEP